ncbi:hypothetical protein MCOR27_010335 [Pyricularia oryzae]|uniref:Uncharacterized protein n=1 Tax=Pyricularia grisea TaxID=148305 RepID=A0ABQ8NYV9_PYRGI|nr:hypothetical protein MCOR01_004483 [Pyricularia oryzae]KAI6302751.1 hypothetical protein MCOR33_002020 [Pyricularia grisea]KAI6253362.1 hypothetical protein MCOR19_010088 [Pyricularia oryzae]KAI6268046.1 hypothetical protein MCOR27_010335 [Pyricularia oryzae]KAI6306381.1 hypothetical protein MCOR29_010143 [Pyricularia oryzae]
MPPLKQNTFLVLPNAPPNPFTHGAPPPVDSLPGQPIMTSKQARKSYNERTRGQKRSKAEQREWERAEQERIRKELEKEQNATKARAARERKKAKDQAVLEQKKKQGLPLVSVRPSQDTIARFVRKGNKREREPEQVAPEAKQDDEGGVHEAGGNSKSPSGTHKRPRLSIIEELDVEEGHADPPPISPSISIERIPQSPPKAPGSGSHSNRPLKPQEDTPTTVAEPAIISVSPPQHTSQALKISKDPTRASESVVDTVSLLDDGINTAMKASANTDKSVSQDKSTLPNEAHIPSVDRMPQEKPSVLGWMDETTEYSSRPVPPAAAAAVRINKTTSVAPNPGHSAFSDREKSRPSKLKFSTASNINHKASTSTSAPVPKVKQTSMGPPPVPSARKPLVQVPRDAAVKQSQACSKPEHPIPNPVAKVTAVPYPQPPAQPEPMPPSSTQNFLETYFLDMMPTPSQEERELCGDENTKPGLMGPPPRPMPPNLNSMHSRSRSFQSHSTPKMPPINDRNPKNSKQKFAPPPVPRWIHGHGPQPRVGQTSARPTVNANRLSNHPTPVGKAQQPVVTDLSFLSTQDVMMSTQDVLEVEEPTISVPKKATHTGAPKFLRQHTSVKSDTKQTSASLNPKSAIVSKSLAKSKEAPSTRPSALFSQSRASQPRRDPKISIEDLFDSHDHKTSLAKNVGPRNSQSTSVARSQEPTGALGGKHVPDQPNPQEQTAPSQSAQQDPFPIPSAGADDNAPRATSGSTDSEAPDSQGRPRYFTSSCTNIRIGLATLESMRTFEAEQRKREEQSKKREARALLAKEKQQAAEQKRRADTALLAANSFNPDPTATGLHRDTNTSIPQSTGVAGQQEELDEFANDLIFTLSQEEIEIGGGVAPLNSQTLRRFSSGPRPPLASTQETDYGDLDIGESLAILEAENL